MESGSDSTAIKPDAAIAPNAASAPAPDAKKPRSGLRLPLVPILGFLFLSFLLGAATMFFRLPLSGTLSKGFMGARAWTESHIAGKQSAGEMRPASASNIDRPEKTFDGYTLYACASQTAPSTRVSLIDMQQKVVHEWSVSFARIWPNPPQLQGRQIDDSQVCVFACHLYPNGDLLVVFHSLEKTVRGYGLAKVDKDSQLIWSYSANVHHDVTVGEDGTIYTIVQRPLNESIKGLEFIPTPWLVDHLVVLSPDGKELQEPISILEALRNSSYSTLLSPLETALKPVDVAATTDDAIRDLRMKQDVLHTNSVNVLSRAMAPKFPQFKPGQVLLSIRSLHAIAVLDPSTRTIVWGTRGPWNYQHDAQFLENGHLLLFDNIGSPRGSRVLEYNPKNGSFPWSYPGIDNAPFFTSERGMAQRLPNGNTLVAVSEGREIFEVTEGKEVVWTCVAHSFITTARRYAPDRITFLKPGQRPRN
ncbi:MAG TPA: arylsulfotransferase family protein [Gemmata sp.]|jgi:hypothetical protein|nr:arylsulfotransferase family protein [Gemmata sp.]